MFTLALSLAGVGVVTFAGTAMISVNATTVGFAYLLLVLIVASTLGFFEAMLTSVAATLCFNFFFLPPVGRLTIADPQNWVALFSFLVTSLIASRLSAVARGRTRDAQERQKDVERLYAFSRAILLIEPSDSFPRQLAQKLADIFELDAVVLYERRIDQFFRAGPHDVLGMDESLRQSARTGTLIHDAAQSTVITAVRLGAGPIAGLALKGREMPDSVLQGISNLVAIGLERSRAQDLASQIEAARQSEKFRTTLLDALAHELKTPLTSVMAATTSLLADPDQPSESRMELLKIAEEEARHLRELIDEAVEVGRLDSSTSIEVQAEPCDISDIVREVLAAMQPLIDSRTVKLDCGDTLSNIAVDRRLVRLAVKQLIDNALKYSPPNEPIGVDVHDGTGTVTVAVTDRGPGIPPSERERIFDRLYRSPSVARQVPGSGLGLSIAHNIARAHHGDLTVSSRPGETTFSLMLPSSREENDK